MMIHRFRCGLHQRLSLLSSITAAARHITSHKVYLDAWTFYLLLRQKTLPLLSSRVEAMFPEFRGAPSVEGIQHPLTPFPHILSTHTIGTLSKTL